jgi:hypothetical protein
VVNAIPSIIRFIGEEQSKPDPLPLKDLFFLPDDSPNRYPPTQKRPSGDAEAGTGENHKPPPKARPKHYTLSQIDGGFIIRRGSEGISVPQFIEVWAAYDTRRGNPLAAYSPSDFRIGHAGIEVEPRGVIMAECDLNCLKAEIRNDDFEIRVTGFDKNRDLHIVTKVRLPEVSTETEEEGSEVNDA